MQEVFLSDNAGHRVPPADAPDPVQGTGQLLTNGTADADTTATVVGGKRYVFTSMATGAFYFGILAVTTPANVAWVCPLEKAVIIVIPAGVTTLHYATDTNDGKGYLRELSE
jgi:hypothetical protein